MCEVEAFTDGSCDPNPGVGGWASVLLIKNGTTITEEILSGSFDSSTNNRMEMLAVIESLERFPEGTNINIHTDSKYVKDGITIWVINWIAKGWKTVNRKPVKNQDLWKRMMDAKRGKKVEWIWIKGHNGHEMNERADRIAKNERIKISEPRKKKIKIV